MRVLSIVLAALLIAGICGCSGGGAKGKNKDLDRPPATNK